MMFLMAGKTLEKKVKRNTALEKNKLSVILVGNWVSFLIGNIDL